MIHVLFLAFRVRFFDDDNFDAYPVYDKSLLKSYSCPEKLEFIQAGLLKFQQQEEEAKKKEAAKKAKELEAKAAKEQEAKSQESSSLASTSSEPSTSKGKQKGKNGGSKPGTSKPSIMPQGEEPQAETAEAGGLSFSLMSPRLAHFIKDVEMAEVMTDNSMEVGELLASCAMLDEPLVEEEPQPQAASKKRKKGSSSGRGRGRAKRGRR